MKPTVLAAAAILLMTFAGRAAAAGPQILTEDVTRFYQVYDAAHGHPSVEQLDRDYLAKGTPGLHEFAKARNVTGVRIADTIDKHPETYTNARPCMAALPAVKRRLITAFAKLARVYPEAKFPPVTLVVGRGRPVGITDASGVLIGLEAMCSATFMNPNLEDALRQQHRPRVRPHPAARRLIQSDEPGRSGHDRAVRLAGGGRRRRF